MIVKKSIKQDNTFFWQDFNPCHFLGDRLGSQSIKAKAKFLILDLTILWVISQKNHEKICRILPFYKAKQLSFSKI